MEVYHIQSVEVSVPAVSDKEKQKWVEEHARRFQHLFEQWQKPLGIDGDEYRKHLAVELADYFDDPVWKSLIELIP